MEMRPNFRIWPILVLLSILSLPLVLMYFYLVVDTVTDTTAGSLLPDRFTLEHWKFLFEKPETGRASIWPVTANTFLFASSTSLIVVMISLTAGYALSRLNMPFRKFFLGGILTLHAFPTVTLIIAIFLMLQMSGLYNTLIGVILVKTALELPLGIWIMKGFYDTVPWEIEMAGITDGASRFTVWWKLVLPQVQPGIAALALFSFLEAWKEFILPQVLAPSGASQVLATYLQNTIMDDRKPDFNLFKSIGLFYALPVILIYVVFNRKLMNIYGGGTKG
ncbi:MULTISPECIES: carbohydrate ABC transporter permease [Stappiaceae]|jgi:inositol-phosphate transport system permease protein|uniref:Maltose/maltodextrin transport system permease protein MalG n=1 Tax=Roseibium aggregatum (strain ATCC 25650 / DSM 13394 / JCM 20685 / NBRC 16684 / NCIMB 2208 / IAM 12614 / B1) TaxID=384765 RepID=A0NRR1_ROSAI|nr:putative sugar ABC transporter, permease protein [Roseibium aggregatum IAM 12614]